jgi:integrase
VLSLYLRNVAINHARPPETKARVDRLEDFWGKKRLSDVSGKTCREYVALRSTPAAARRELEELRAAINYHRREGLHNKIVSVVLPEREPPRERWLTRDEAAHLIFTTWRYRDTSAVREGFRGLQVINRKDTNGHKAGTYYYAWKGGPRIFERFGTPAFEARFHELTKERPNEVFPRRHIAKFMLVASYMGSRASVICAASIEPERPAGKPWIDLRTGFFYGRGTGERETKKRKQLVRVPGSLLAHLRRWRRAGQRYAVEFRGEPVLRVSKGHAQAVRAAGFGPDVTPHTWRHTVASWLMQSGVNAGDAAEFLAMSEAVLLRVYRHQRPDVSGRIAAARRAHRKAG